MSSPDIPEVIEEPELVDQPVENTLDILSSQGPVKPEIDIL